MLSCTFSMFWTTVTSQTSSEKRRTNRHTVKPTVMFGSRAGFAKGSHTLPCFHKGRRSVNDYAMPGCGPCYFDCRFRIGLLASKVKVVAQVLSPFSGGREGQNALVACSCLRECIFQVLIHANGRVVLRVVSCIHIIRGMAPMDESEARSNELVFTDRGRLLH